MNNVVLATVSNQVRKNSKAKGYWRDESSPPRRGVKFVFGAKTYDFHSRRIPGRPVTRPLSPSEIGYVVAPAEMNCEVAIPFLRAADCEWVEAIVNERDTERP
jgi:hypothetical protein